MPVLDRLMEISSGLLNRDSGIEMDGLTKLEGVEQSL
jgi:hypothetical protein